MRLSFHGADRGVTGSCHLVECGGRRLLVDSGLYQGRRELEASCCSASRPAARGTLARALVDGARHVHQFGEEVAVRSRIHTINGFSAHADRDELLDWHGRVGAARTFLVHGGADVMDSFAERLQGTSVERPALGEAFEL